MTKRIVSAAATGSPAVPPLTPAPFVHQPELRAFQRFANLPANHMTVEVDDHSFSPHLLKGEFAVVDLSETEPVGGEFFVIAYNDARSMSGCSLHLCIPEGSSVPFNVTQGVWERQCTAKPGHIYEDRMMWWVSHQYLARRPDPFSKEYDHMLRTGQLKMSEGPFATEHLRSKLVGRVVGYLGSDP